MYNLLITSTVILSMAFSGTLTGTVNFEGKTKKRKPIPMDSDPICGNSHKDDKALSERFIVDKDEAEDRASNSHSNLEHDIAQVPIHP